MKAPQEYEQRILLVVIGMTPQIVTETLYKLAVEKDEPFIPTEVHLITTKQGAESAKNALLGVAESKGWFYQLCEDYNLSNIKLSENTIHIIEDTEGQFIDDNQSTEHNKIASDFIVEKVRQFTEKDDSALHVSLAGGRKTMSFYAGYALSLYGRPQDRLSHVLVDSVFQLNKNFFYPRPVPERLEINDKYYNTADAKIILSDIPIVKMRNGLPEILRTGGASYQQAIDTIQASYRPPTLHINVTEKKINIGGNIIGLEDAQLALYLWVAESRKNCDSAILSLSTYEDDYLAVYKRIVGDFSGYFEAAENFSEQLTSEKKEMESQSKENVKSSITSQEIEENLSKLIAKHFSPRKTKIKNEIVKGAGEFASKYYELIVTTVNNQKIYSINVPPENITIVN